MESNNPKKHNRTPAGEARRVASITGESNPAKRPEVRESISKSKTGVKRAAFSAECIASMSDAHRGEKNGMYGKSHREDSKSAQRLKAELYCWVNDGITDSRIPKDEIDKYIAKGMKRGRVGKKTGARPKITCPHCGALSAANTYARFHGDNCKHKK